MAENYTRSYQVFSADRVTNSFVRELDGETVIVNRSVVSVQLVGDDGATVALNVPAGAAHPFEAGARVSVTFSAEE